MERRPVRNFIAACGHALTEPATVRNNLLHALPATHPQQDQRLDRAGTRKKSGKFVLDGTQFWIADEWLDEQATRLNELLDHVNSARKSLRE